MVYRRNESYDGLAKVEKLEQVYVHGALAKSRHVSEEQIYFSGLQPVGSRECQIIEDSRNPFAAPLTGDLLLPTCLEELDSYSKIQELVLRYPKLDTEWLPEKQVSQWLFSIQMPQSVIEVFVQNQIDGYALLELT